MLKGSYVLAVSVAVATLVPVSLAFTPYGIVTSATPNLGVYDNRDSRIEDARGDAKPVFQNEGTDPVPEVRDYHDILGASVSKRGDAFFLTIDLAGNPNSNQEYETLYRWHIITTSPITNRDQQYTIIFPHFAPDNDNSTAQGWYFAVYDENVNAFIVRPTSIMDMPEDRVEFPLEDAYIGNPSNFVYWVDVSVRLNATFGEPDYLMDYAP